MSGAGAQKRVRAAQILAYQLRQKGLTNRQIAEQLGKDVQQVPGMVELGERFSRQPERYPPDDIQ